MGFRGKYQTKTSDSPTTNHFMPPILFPGCHVKYATMCTVTQEVKVSCRQLQSNLLLRETMARSQSAFMVRTENSWRPQSPAGSACIKHNCYVVFCALRLCTGYVFITQIVLFFVRTTTKLSATHNNDDNKTFSIEFCPYSYESRNGLKQIIIHFLVCTC